MERLEQRNFFDNIPEAKTDTPEDRLREAVGHYLDLGALRSLDVPVTELHRAFRYEPERMPEEIKKMVAVLEVLSLKDRSTDARRVLGDELGNEEQRDGARYDISGNRELFVGAYLGGVTKADVSECYSVCGPA